MHMSLSMNNVYVIYVGMYSICVFCMLFCPLFLLFDLNVSLFSLYYYYYSIFQVIQLLKNHRSGSRLLEPC